MFRVPKAAAAAAVAATFTLLSTTLFFGVFHLGTAVLAGLTALLWLRLLTARGQGPLWLGKTAKWLCRLGWGAFLGCCLVMYALTLAHLPPADTAPAVIVVPGAQLKGDRPGTMLQNRLDCGLQLWEQRPDSVFVVSGGKSRGEACSEAEVMALYLIQNGVDPEDIYREEQAANTEENFAFSAEIIEEKGLQGQVIIATDTFHQTRCRLWAVRSGLADPCSAPCRPSRGIAPVYWLREVCGMAFSLVFPR